MVGIRYSPGKNTGLTFIELLVFLVVVGIALAALTRTFTAIASRSVYPLTQLRALELAQSTMDEILARKFDENTPSGGIPACDSAAGPACLGISPDAKFDDVGDFNGYIDNSDAAHSISVVVSNAGTELGLAASEARRITVTVSYVSRASAGSSSDSLVLTAYKLNF